MELENSKKKKSPVLIPFASGKGGVGKSVITANLAIALAGLGFQTAAVDMDLGGSNLHSFLGLPNKFPGIGDFIKTQGPELEEFLVPTGIENLKFIPGDGLTPFMANISYYRKQRLLSDINKIPADFILMDLGGGTSFNVLDFFGLSNRGVLITCPGFPSIISMMGFLKNFLFRLIERKTKNNKKVRQLLDQIYNRPMGDKQVTIPMLREEVGKVDIGAGEIIEKICTSVRPRVIFNMGEHPADMTIIKQFARGLQTVLSLEADYFGFIFSDPRVPLSVKKREPLLLAFPDCPASMEINQVARRIVQFRDQPIENSAQLLIESTRKFYEKYS